MASPGTDNTVRMKHHWHILSLVLPIFLLSFAASAAIPQKEKRIYLVDVTSSMQGGGSVETPDIFNTVKASLIETLQEIADTTTEIEIIPFTNKVHKGINATIAQRDTLIDFINKLEVKKGDTNIADAWSEGVSKTDTTKINYLFILTDGLHNCGPKKTVLYKRLSAWEDYSADSYLFAFYVMLTKNAEESEIRTIADETRNMWKIEGLNINASLLKTEREIRQNIFSDKTIKVSFLTNNPKVDLKNVGMRFLLEDNPHYEIVNQRPTDVQGVFTFDIKEKCDKNEIPLCDTLHLSITHNQEDYPFVFITPDIVALEISNVGPRYVLSTMNGKRIGKDVDFGEVYFREPLVGIFKKIGLFRKSLRYWPYSLTVPDTNYVSSTIKLSFNEDAVRSGASLSLSLNDKNGRRLNDDQAIVYSNERFTASSDTADFHFRCKVLPSRKDTIYSGSILAESVAIDAINDLTINSSCQSIANWYCSQVIKPNFPAWILWILSIIILLILAALLLWLIYKLVSALLRYFSECNSGEGKPDDKKKYKVKERVAGAPVLPFLDYKDKTLKPRITKKEKTENCIEEALVIERILSEPSTVADKYDRLEELRLLIDSYYRENNSKLKCGAECSEYDCKHCKFRNAEHSRHDKCKEELESNTWDALEDAWRLEWPRKDLMVGDDKPPYTYRVSKLSIYYSKCKSKKFFECKYDEHGSPDFERVTCPDSIVDISDLYIEYTPEELKKRGGDKNSIQYRVQIERMAPQLESTIRDWWTKRGDGSVFKLDVAFWKWRDANDLVPHEDTNCRTMRLVYRPAHKAFHHRGGIANAINIITHFKDYIK